MSTLEKVREIVAAELGIYPEDVKAASSLAALGADSMDKIDLLLELEEQFGIEIPNDDAVKIVTVQDIADYVDSRS